MKNSVIQTPSKNNESKKFIAKKSMVFKKAKELSTLCGVDVALIMYHLGNPEPDFWCSKPDSITTILSLYLRNNNNKEKQRGIVQQSFSEVGSSSSGEYYRGFGAWDSEFIQSLGVDELKHLEGVLAGQIGNLNERIKVMRGGSTELPESSLSIDDLRMGINLDDLEFNFGELESNVAKDELCEGGMLGMIDDLGVDLGEWEGSNLGVQDTESCNNGMALVDDGFDEWANKLFGLNHDQIWATGLTC